MPILVSTITTIVVFFPVLFLVGIARNLFMPLALTIAFALIMSFFVSRTVTPLLCLYGAARRPATRARRRIRAAGSPALLDAAGRRLRPRAHLGAAATAAVTIVVILVLFAASLAARASASAPSSSPTPTSRSSASPTRRRSAPASSAPSRSRSASSRRWTRRPARRRSSHSHDHDHRQRAAGRTHRHLQPEHRPARGHAAGEPGLPKGDRSISDVEAAEKVRSALRDALPGHAALLLHRRHREAHPELRLRRADRRRDPRLRPRGGRALRAAGLTRRCAASTTPTASRSSPTCRSRARRTTPSSTWRSIARRPACSGSPSRTSRQTVLTSLIGNTQFPPIPFTDPSHRQRVLHQRPHGRPLPRARRRPRGHLRCAPRRRQLVALDTRRTGSSDRAARC